MSRKPQFVAGSEDAYSQLKVITDAAQAGELRPWSPKVVELLNAYGVVVERRNDIQAEITLSFPTTPERRSMAIGVRYLKPNGTWTEDFFLFEESRGLTKHYRGTQEEALPEYKGTHHGQPSIALQEALPSIQQEIAALKTQLEVKDIFGSIDIALIVTPAEHHQRLAEIDREFKATVQSISSRAAGTPVSHLSMQIKPEFDKRRATQMHLWSKSESIYTLKLDQLSDMYRTDSSEFAESKRRLDRLFGKAEVDVSIV